MEAQDRAAGGRSSWIEEIVVAADGSTASRVGLEEVAYIAARLGAKVTVAHVRHVPAAALMAPSVGNQSVIDALDEQEAEVRRDATRLLGGTGIDWEFVVRVGSPGEELVKLVEATGADLVVVGSNRHTSLHNLILGSTAAYLTAHSPAAVLVMRARAPKGAGATTAPRPGGPHAAGS